MKVDIKLLGALAFAIYGIVIFVISHFARKKTNSMTQFAVGNRDMGVGIVSFTLASSFTSSAMLLIMPGYIYLDGLAGILYLLVFQQLGLLVGLLVVGTKIRRDGTNEKIISLPDFLRRKYESNFLSGMFSIMTLSLITYMVVVVIGVAYLLMNLLSISYVTAIVITVLFVFAYSIAGGSYVHSYTNVFQSMLMLLIVVYIFGRAFPDSMAQWNQFVNQTLAVSPDYFSFTNSNSYIFSTYTEVVYAAFLMGFCNVFQPHIFNKALYLDKKKSWTKVSLLSFVIMTIFNLAVVSGVFIRMRMPELANPDSVMSMFIAQQIPAGIGVLITVALSAAAMSTLDGLIVGMSSVLGGEINNRIHDDRKTLKITRALTVAIGLIVVLIAIKPRSFIGIYGMWGFNILMASAFIPTLMGLFMKKPKKEVAIASAFTAILVFVYIMGTGKTINGALGASIAVPAAMAVGGLVYLLTSRQGGKEISHVQDQDATSYEESNQSGLGS